MQMLLSQMFQVCFKCFKLKARDAFETTCDALETCCFNVLNCGDIGVCDGTINGT